MDAAGRRSVLVVRGEDRDPALAPLLSRLEAAAELRVGDMAAMTDLGSVDAIFVDSPGDVDAEAAERLDRFVANGGTAVLAAGTLADWARQPRIAAMAGWAPDGRTVATELRFHTVDGARFTAHDTVHLLGEAPDAAQPLLHAAYRHRDHIAAYERGWGAGLFVYLGVGRDARSYREPVVQALVLHAVRGAGTAHKVLRVGMLGYGALGPAHADAIRQIPGLQLTAVCDRSPARRDAAAALAVTTVVDSDSLLADDVDVILVSTPPATHAAAVIAALSAGKHVVCEKPFALSTRDCDAAIDSAQRAGLMLTVVHNRRWDPDFVRLCQVVREGRVGEIFHMESFVGRFAHPCNYWHSEATISGGAVFDWGSHHVDWMLQLIDGRVETVRCVEHKHRWHDVTNSDHLTLEMRFGSGAQAFFTHSELAAASKPKWYVLGTEGAVVGDWQQVTLHRRGPDGEVDSEVSLPTDMPSRLSVHRPDADGGTHIEVQALPRRDRCAFWRNVSAHLHDQEPLAVTAAQARRTVAVLEASVQSAAAGGALVPLDV